MTNLHPMRNGKSLLQIQIIKQALRDKKRMVIACRDQIETMNWLRLYFPSALFLIVGDWGVQPIIRNKKELEL